MAARVFQYVRRHDSKLHVRVLLVMFGDISNHVGKESLIMEETKQALVFCEECSHLGGEHEWVCYAPQNLQPTFLSRKGEPHEDPHTLNGNNRCPWFFPKRSE